MPNIEIRLFGYPRIASDGMSVPVRRRKALALISYLATTATSHSRDVLASLLWPEHETARASAFLRNALWVLNRTPLADCLVTSRHTIGLRIDESVDIDVIEFRQALSQCLGECTPKCLERLAQATELYKSDFLAGFSVDESEPFEDWHYSESSALRHELSAAFDRLSQEAELSGATDEAHRYLRRWVDLEPLNEDIHRRLMRFYVESGRRSEALRQFDRCVEILDHELGLSPSDETRSLLERIRARDESVAVALPKKRSLASNLPTYRTAFVGRESELARAVELLRGGDCRLLSVTGAGGCGKSRLAVEAASQLIEDFPDGVVHIPLVAMTTSSAVPLEIEDVLGAYGASDIDIEGTDATPGLFSDLLLARLKPQRMLLLLDNLEHLLADLRWLATLLEKAPEIKLLVTSRHQLNVLDEWVLPLEGLPFPDSDVPIDELAKLDSVALFIQAARRANAAFSPSETDWAAISEIVRLLEGIPLGVELAAAWVRTTSCQTIASEIGKSLDFLSTRLRDVPKRHHSLRAVFEQSWTLLSREQRKAFRRMSVFRGGCTREAGEIVASATLPVLSGLVARSLLRPTATQRVELLEVLRQYAEERLRANPDEEAQVRNAHATYYLSLLSEQEHRLKGSFQRQASELLLADVDNIRAAWRHATDARMAETLGRSAIGLFLFCDMRNHFDEGTRLFHEAAAEYAEHQTDPERVLFGFLRGVEGWFNGMRHGDEGSTAIFDESLSVLEESGAARELAFIGLLAAFNGHGEIEARESRLRDALTFYESVEASWEQAEVLEALAWILFRRDEDQAIEYAERAAEIHSELDDPWGVAMARYTLGTLYTAIGDHVAASRELEASLELRRKNELDPIGAMQCIASLGYLAREAGDITQAAMRYHEALAIAEKMGASWAQAVTHESLVTPSWMLEERDMAVYHAKAATTIYRSFGRDAAAERVEATLAALESGESASPQEA